MKLSITVPLTAVVMAVAAACAGGSPSSDPGSGLTTNADGSVSLAETPTPDTSRPAVTPPTIGKYEQTWHMQYDKTSCNQWLNKMNPHQRFVAAADMLAGARDKGDGGTGVPGDTLVNEFKRDVDDNCEVTPRDTLADIGAATYLTERSKYRP